MSRTWPTRLTRRDVIAGAAALAAAGVASRTLAQNATPVNGTQPDGTWTFTDDRGVTVTLPARPERIIADVNVAAALWDFGIRPVGIFGWNVTGEKSFNAAGGNVDPEAVVFLNDAATTLDVEKAAVAQPDLIVSLVFAPQYGVWSIDQKVQPAVESIAPIVTISGIIRADESMNRFAELAAALGADLESAEIVAQREAYDAAVTSYETAIAAKQGLDAVFIWASPAEIYVANPNAAGDVMLFRDLGLTVPKIPVAEGEYWELLAAEQALKYPTDMLFYSLRSELQGIEDFAAHPTFSQHPAVLAGQVYGWNQDFILNYPGMTASLDAITAAVSAANIL